MPIYPKDVDRKVLAGFTAILTAVWLIPNTVGCSRPISAARGGTEETEADAKFRQSVERKVEELYLKYRNPYGSDTSDVAEEALWKILPELLAFFRDDAKAPVVAGALSEAFCREPVFSHPDALVLWDGFKHMFTYAQPDTRIEILDALVTKMDNRERVRKEFEEATDYICSRPGRDWGVWLAIPSQSVLHLWRSGIRTLVHGIRCRELVRTRV